LLRKKIGRPFRCSSSPQKVTLGSAVRLQARSQRFALATNFLRFLVLALNGYGSFKVTFPTFSKPFI